MRDQINVVDKIQITNAAVNYAKDFIGLKLVFNVNTHILAHVNISEVHICAPAAYI